jgi:hypothetical protein
MLQNLQGHGYPVAIALILFTAAAGLWKNKRLHWVSAWMFGGAAFFMALGFTPWTDVLARLIDSGPGFVVLLVIDVILLIEILASAGFWDKTPGQKVRRKKHRFKHPVLMIVAGTAALMSFGSSTRLIREAARSPKKTGSALQQSISQISSGHAAHHMSQHGALRGLLIAVAIVAVLFVVGHKHEKGTGGRGAFGSGPRAIGGSSSSGSPGNSPAVFGKRGRS